MQLTLILTNSLRKDGRKGNGEYAGKSRLLQAERMASTSIKLSYPAQFESTSCEPRSPSLSTKSVKGQMSLEYYLLIILTGLLALAIIVWASKLSISEEAARTNAQDAIKNLTHGLLPAIPNATYSDSSNVSFELHTFEPYLSGEPAFFQINAFAPSRAKIPRLILTVKTQSGEHVRVEPSYIDSATFTFSDSYSAQFYPAEPGVYTITISCGDTLIERDVIVR